MSLISITVNKSSQLLEFIAPIIGVAISAFIAWLVYRKQLVEKDIKENISKFFYVFYLISKNFEELSNIKYQISEPALAEIRESIKALSQAEKLFDWEIGIGACPANIVIPESSKHSYIQSELQKLSKKMTMTISTRYNFLFIDKQPFEKEASILAYYGDTDFQFICNRLNTSYHVIDDIQQKILMHNEENAEKPRTMYKEITIIWEKDKYKKQISDINNQLLYRETIFQAYDETVNRALIYSYNALNHLEVFFNKYKDKYKHSFKAIGIPYKTFGIKHESLIAEDDFWKMFSLLNKYEYSFFAIPLYTNLKRTFKDKLSDFIFYGKW